jgi:hypothetical protein
VTRGRLATAARLAVAIAALVAVPRLALAEAVECPTCWRLIEDGPCRCPFDNTPLPGRVCPPEPQTPAPAPEARERERQGGERHLRPPEGGTKRAHVNQPAPAKRRVVRHVRPAPQPEPTREPERETRVVRRAPPPERQAPADEDVTESEPDESDESDEADVPDEPVVRRHVNRQPERTASDDQSDEPAASNRPQRDPYRRGPAFLAGYRYFGVYDWVGEGNSHAFTVEGYPFGQYVEWLRIGLGLDVGFRRAESHTDWIMNGFVSLGAQYPRRIAPYGNVQIGGGTMYRRRFGQGLTDGLLTVGVNAGATFRLSRTFVADVSVGYLFLYFDKLSFHSPNIRIGIGW